ncbi:hypothetical protein [Chondromyces crocatus]|uniref:Uncharacterized protein n=1 Tax=Chondromyces crocatus TaxID=52 RepID=A0A0K1ECT6_CHOCO|nr:hypothetical protein [Chondromyces crocatus]AKT38680.1 uncharacterized protein CMC5_028280 [Chondromyces crocatus]
MAVLVASWKSVLSSRSMDGAAQKNAKKSPLKSKLSPLLLVLAVGFVGLIVVMRPGGKPCTTRSYTSEPSETVCSLEGVVEVVDDANRALNAREMVGGDDKMKLDYFHLVDEAGRAIIFFDSEKHTIPTAGQRVKVNARVVGKSENAATRLMAESWE